MKKKKKRRKNKEEERSNKNWEKILQKRIFILNISSFKSDIFYHSCTYYIKKKASFPMLSTHKKI